MKKLKEERDKEELVYKEGLEKYSEFKKTKQESVTDENTIKYAYIVFRSMEGMQKALQMYNISRTYRCMTWACGCCCRRRKERLINMLFYKEWPTVEKATLPD